MNYPKGEVVKTEDVIWWNEGSCIGRVGMIVDTAEKMAIKSESEPGFYISPGIRLPFVNAVFQPHSDFEDDAIGLLSESELVELYEAIEIAQAGFTEDVLELGEPFITNERHDQTGSWYWRMTFEPERDWAVEYNPTPIYSCMVLRKDDH